MAPGSKDRRLARAGQTRSCGVCRARGRPYAAVGCTHARPAKRKEYPNENPVEPESELVCCSWIAVSHCHSEIRRGPGRPIRGRGAGALRGGRRVGNGRFLRETEGHRVHGGGSTRSAERG